MGQTLRSQGDALGWYISALQADARQVEAKACFLKYQTAISEEGGCCFMATAFRIGRTRLWIQGAIWICFFAIFGVSMLLEQMGLLNTVDLGWVGGEDGTFWQFATNVWYLDLMAGLLFAVAAILGCVELLIRLMWGTIEAATSRA